MADTSSLPLFLASVMLISLTGVMMPGPVTALTITRGIRRREAGALIAVGHGIIEALIILFIYLGFARFFRLPIVTISIGLAGGLFLLWMGFQMFMNRNKLDDQQKQLSHNSVVAGLTLTAVNPYFFLWWATIGTALLASARSFGSGGVLAMGVTHWLCDFSWLFLLSFVVFKSRQLWTYNVHKVVFSVCSALLASFGVWFLYSAIHLAMTAGE
jgi:threonine/homoserine/homoserine lactone efflux protein